jgi:hypothetical protein
VLFHTVHELRNHRRSRREIHRDGDAVPCAGSKNPRADVAALALAEVVALPEEIAIARVVQVINLDHRGRARAFIRDEYIVDQRILIYFGPAAVW